MSAGFLALWFALTMVDAGWLHECAMHSPRAQASSIETSSASHDVAAGAEHAAHGAGHVMADSHATTPDETSPEHSGHQCVCIGACSVAQVATVDFADAVLEPALIDRGQAIIVATPRWFPTSIAHQLPFATAPPTA